MGPGLLWLFSFLKTVNLMGTLLSFKFWYLNIVFFLKIKPLLSAHSKHTKGMVQGPVVSVFLGDEDASQRTLRLAWRSRCLRAILGSRETWEQCSTHPYPTCLTPWKDVGLISFFFPRHLPPHPQLPLKARDRSDIGA